MQNLPVLLALILILNHCTAPSNPLVEIKKNNNIVLIDNNLGSRMMNDGFFETEVQLQFSDSLLVIRNMCDGGNTPGFRPHAGRISPWAFPGAEQFYTELANPSHSEGHFESPDEWLTRLNADIILAFFGYNESFAGPAGLPNFKNELNAFIKHTLNQTYNGQSSPQLVLISPIAFQDLSKIMDLPNGKIENKNLSLYTTAMEEIASQNQIPFLDAFTSSKKWFESGEQLTIDGFQLNQKGYQKFTAFLIEELFGKHPNQSHPNYKLVLEAVQEKNWFWHNDFKIPNGVHVFGRRYEPFGPDNYPFELKKIREMTAIRDQAIWEATKEIEMDLEKADQQTTELPTVSTNYKPQNNGVDTKYLYDDQALASISVPPGYKIECFASEKEFPNLANPVQLSFDNKGRLWVACMPSYPHYKPGDPKPNDKLLILEDTNQDGKADKQTVFADNLHLPIGFEFAPEGVYVSQGTNLILLQDTNDDDQTDQKEIILSGFDDHDTHHAINAFCADPSGAIYMGEGLFLHTNVETAYGPVRATNGGFYRYNPTRRHLERTAQLSIPNPWGIAFDEWGQVFYEETSGPNIAWMMPGSIRPTYGVGSPKSRNLIEEDHQVRPTSGLEFISSRHFPDEVQGDMLVNNTIGFLGTKQHQIIDDGTGYQTKYRQDLMVSSDPNFRPVDLEFAPDGSLYIVDWQNVLIGHMQHNARDPLRDHVHGRIYRITYPSRPLIEPAQVHGAPIETLLENLKLPEYRTRYRSRRELRGRKVEEVLKALATWVEQLDQSDSKYEQYILEALWVSWGLNQVVESLLHKALSAKDFKVRAAAVRVLRYATHQIKDYGNLFLKAAQDKHGRVRLEAIVAASWLNQEKGIPILKEAAKLPLDDWMEKTYAAALKRLEGRKYEKQKKEKRNIASNLKGDDLKLYELGKAIYFKDGYCNTCHQADGKGLANVGYPPLAETAWVTGDEKRLIKLTLKGIYGPMEVNGKPYPGAVPMTPFEGLLNDEELAGVLTYIRNSFGNEARVIKPEEVQEVKKAVKAKEGFYSPTELLKAHPMQPI